MLPVLKEAFLYTNTPYLKTPPDPEVTDDIILQAGRRQPNKCTGKVTSNEFAYSTIFSNVY